MLEVDDLRAELMLIDERLCRNDLSPAERSAANTRRKAIWQQLHPESKPGGDRRSNAKVEHLKNESENNKPSRYDEVAAEETGQASSTVRRDCTRGEALGEDALARVARTSPRRPGRRW